MAGGEEEFGIHAFRWLIANGTIISIESKTEPLTSVDGVIKVPTGPGSGVIIDPDYINTHEVFKG